MPDQKGHCLEEWESAKEAFETNTKKKKPTDKFLGFFRLGNNLSATLKKMDAAYDKAVKEVDDKAALKQWQGYRQMVEDFAKERAKYKVTLKKASDGEQEATQLDKEITVLSKTLSMIESGARINAITKVQLAEKALSTAPKPQGKEAKERELMIDTAKKTAPSLAASIKFAAMFAAKVKASPTPAVFNREIQDAARKLNQNIANIPKIFKTTGDSLGVDVKRAEAIGKVLDAWGSGKRKVPDNADEKMVLRELGAYMQMLSACKVVLNTIQAAGK